TATVSGVAVAGPQAVADAGAVRLTAAAVGLQGVTATAERAAVLSTPDRTVVSTRDMPAVSGGNATDVLRNVPGVDVDGEGKVSLRGNQNVAIQINGRAAPLKGDALTNFIRQLPANLVDRIEVVTNPSAKEDPDGMGGILNIVLKQNTEIGTSGGFTVGAGTWGKYNASASLGGQRGPVTLFGSYGFSRDPRSQNGLTLRSAFLDGVPESFLETIQEGHASNYSHTANANAEWKITQRNVLSSAFMMNLRPGDLLSGTDVSALDASRVLVDDYDLVNSMRARGITTDYAAAFRRILQPQKNELGAQVHFNRSRDRYVSAFQAVPGEVPPEILPSDSRTDLLNLTRQLDWQGDLTRQLGGATRLELGYKGILRRLTNEFTSDSIVGGLPSPFDHVENNFTYDENVQAGYGLVTETVSPKFSLQGGLRLERATTTFRLADGGEGIPNNYTSLFPSAAATLQLGQKDQVRFSYSKRIQRPASFQLNPFPLVMDRNVVSVGNPHLRPEYTHSFEGSFTHSARLATLTVTPFYRHTVNAVRRYQAFGQGGVDTLTFANLATADSYGADNNLQLRMGRLTGFVGFTAYKIVTDGSNVQSGLGTDAFAWTARTSLNLKLTTTTDLQWSQFYRPETRIEQGRVGAQGMVNVALRQKLNAKSTLTLRVADPFDDMRFSFRTSSSSFAQQTSRSFNLRAVFLSFSYNFGRPPRMRVPQQQQDQPAGGDQPQIPGM
ncbi:MAG TPA: TonB-dependent receptor, partial [Longimicrobiaceae bacterium]